MSIAEQYSRAVNSKNLRVSEGVDDADKLIAAGWVIGGSDLKSLALEMQRWLSGDMRGMSRAVEMMASWIVAKRSAVKSKMKTAYVRSELPQRSEAVDIARAACAWWMNKTCPACGGHGHPLIEGAPVLDESKVCEACGGSGRRSLTAGMTDKQAEMASWLVWHLDCAAPAVFGEMAKKLRRDMEF